MIASKPKISQNTKVSQRPQHHDPKRKELIPMLSSKLFYGGYADIKGFVVAESAEEAVDALRAELRLFTLPCDATELILPNHTIVLTPK